jgi:hypothetical protein
LLDGTGRLEGCSHTLIETPLLEAQP